MKPDLIVTSSYPPPGQVHGQGTVGVASYTKNTLLGISQVKPINILVLAEILPNSPSQYQEDNITIIRCWRRNSFFLYWHLLRHLLTLPLAPILLEFEMAMFGHPIINIPLPLFLFCLRICGRHPTVVFHQVVTNFNDISGHIGQKSGSFVNTILSVLAKTFYRLIGQAAQKIIVFEQFLKDRLAPVINPSKITIIPLVVEKNHLLPSPKNHQFTITAFGFLAWYKGSDWLLDQFTTHFTQYPTSTLRLVLAGGPNPNHLDKPYYQSYLQKIDQLVATHPRHIILTGFVAEKDFPKLFAASDLVVFPYRTGMSSSGPLSQTFTFHRPFLVSEFIAPQLQTTDITAAFNQADLDPQQIIFKLNATDLFQKISYFQSHPAILAKLTSISHQIATSRSPSRTGQLYLQTLKLND